MDMIVELIKKYGIKKVLEAMASYLRKSDEKKDRRLADDLSEACRRYEGKTD